MVTSLGLCASDPPAGGTQVTSSLTPLMSGTNGHHTNGTASFTFSSTGGYKFCYKLSAVETFSDLGTAFITMHGALPHSFTHDGWLEGLYHETITLESVGGLKLGAGLDAVKAVHWYDTCESAAA